ncbi:MAG: di-trans,poly-cis-decaprenylcistransferase [Gammaproteobacteria bacterium]|nr:di-trans,poly-cis-decaprenylcistransferase [Gammaproteobacteria bacterium]NIM73824.1 di-trans,poly-cis-decaprenylcistransferase [Gammaproteobacteria bacterium]NIN39401.1 di-trans,poly-cis-decaprenylcistransferase [Gammaproteobacteria bacterium]NIO25066.1 di-trans,poly-cis-decaprenylcistransferase [Gammaproteobacteria bacterium]NIO65698.1 di-trans,poly-cis-decaprenylcistransferase [Gammaproteobacteria bacterium]
MNADVPSKATQAPLPRHVAIIMDGNGRWADRRRLPRFAGHKAGVETVKGVVRVCGEKGIEALTLFAFSSENWRRPEEEVGLLMGLFMTALEQQVRKLHEHNIRLRVIGDRSAFSSMLQERIEAAESLTHANTGLNLVVAANYGGRWDMTQAARTIAARVHSGELDPAQVTPELVNSLLSLSDLPEPDLFIRTGGEKRVSNFLLWQLAYTELYFTDTLWPDFDRIAFEGALASFATRQRRFGRTGEQIATAQSV